MGVLVFASNFFFLQRVSLSFKCCMAVLLLSISFAKTFSWLVSAEIVVRNCRFYSSLSFTSISCFVLFL